MEKKDIAQLRKEMAAKLAEYLRASGFGSGEEKAAEIVDLLTQGWSVGKKMLDLDKDKILRDPMAPLRHAGDDYDAKKASKVIVYEIETAHRPLTEAEEAAEDEKKAERDARWARDRAVHEWVSGGPSLDTPPPDGVRIDELLDQVVWWVTKDKRAMRITNMEPSHRANLLALMQRNAKAWQNAEFMRYMLGAPEEVWAEASAESPDYWLGQKRLFRALRYLVLLDQAGEDACLIEWTDGKPVGCLTGAKGHACVTVAGHKKRCTCRCGARLKKGSRATEEASKARRELASYELTPVQRAAINQLFPEHAPPTGLTVNEETAQRFMDLGATERMGLERDPDSSDTDMPYRSTAPAEAELDEYERRYGPLGPEDIH